MRRRAGSTPQTAEMAPPEPETPHAPGIFFRHDADAPEREVGMDYRVGAWHPQDAQWSFAVCQVDSRQGGYVVEYGVDGRVQRRHPAAREAEA